MNTITERRIEYAYGPNGDDFTGAFGGPYTWDQLKNQIEDSRWGSNYTITLMQSREVTYGDWRTLAFGGWHE